MSRPGSRASPLAVAIALGLSACADPVPPRMPAPRTTARAESGIFQDVPQGIPQGARAWFHRADQGVHAFRLPYEWFVALEQPDASDQEAGLFGDAAYLERFGFLPSPPGLPLGFVHAREFREPDGARAGVNPATGKPLTGLGMTCAACHTGRLAYNGAELLIDGMPAATRPAAFGNALDLAVLHTKSRPARFDRFAARILGDAASEDAHARLREQIATWLNVGERAAAPFRTAMGEAGAPTPNRPTAFAVDLAPTDPTWNDAVRNEAALNDAVLNDPVRPDTARTASAATAPPVLDASWLGWMSESAIGVRFAETARGAGGPNAATRVVLPGGPEVRARERARRLSGRAPHRLAQPLALPSPKWPAALPPIDPERAAKGKILYAELCLGCHAPPPDPAAPWNGPGWARAAARGGMSPGGVSPAPRRIEAAEIGTDPTRAASLARREVRLPESPDPSVIVYVRAIGAFAERLLRRFTEGPTPSPPQDETPEGQRGPPPSPAYRARPLNGVWAAAPYLHNGAVPTLYDLLSPVAQRPAVFASGGREFDPARVGWRDSPAAGGGVLDTREPGNGNQGHEFRDGPRGNGVIGRGLSEDERLTLIEYLKTL